MRMVEHHPGMVMLRTVRAFTISNHRMRRVRITTAANGPLDMSFARAFQVRNPDAYERLVMDVVRGNQTLFMRRDEVEAAWTWIDPILESWASSTEPPKHYTAGTWGPSASIALIERDGRTWHEDAEE